MRRLISISLSLLILLSLTSRSTAGTYFATDDMLWCNELMGGVATSDVAVSVTFTVSDADEGSGNSGQTIVSTGNGAHAQVAINADGYPKVRWLQSGAAFCDHTSDTLLADGGTYTITAHYDTNIAGVSNSTLYLNGVNDGVFGSSDTFVVCSDLSLADPAPPYDFSVGCLAFQSDDACNSAVNFTGTVHEVCVWEGNPGLLVRLLTENEIYTLGKSQMKGVCQTIKPTYLLADYFLDEFADGAEVNDLDYPNHAAAWTSTASYLDGNGGTSILSKADNYLSHR